MHEQEEQEEQLEQQRKDAAKLVHEAQLFDVEAKAAVKRREKVKQTWEVLCIALGTDENTIKELNKKGAQRGFVNLAYLVVILGCELDLYGFGMAVTGYWQLKGQTFVKMMCIIGPLGYLLGAVMYMCYNGAWDSDNAYTDADKAESDTSEGTFRTAKQPIQIRYFHFLPVCRFYLVVKDKQIDDIEGVFRVNSLSSFSLGIAQICGIIFYALENDWELDLFTRINIVSQFINWFLTFLYFVTPISAKMGSAMKVEALAYNSGVRLRRLWETYLLLVRLDADRDSDVDVADPDMNEDLNMLQKSLDMEIKILGNVTNIDLEPFTMEEKFETLKFLHRSMNSIYATI